jgi:hypothetical protein
LKFIYTKTDKVDLLEGRRCHEHKLSLEGSEFTIEASDKGFRLVGTSPWFIPVEGTGGHHMPPSMQAFASALDQAATHAWIEAQKFRRDDIAKKRIADRVH